MFTEEERRERYFSRWKIYWNCRSSLVVDVILSLIYFQTRRAAHTPERENQKTAWKVSPFRFAGVRLEKYLSSNKSLLKNIIVITICLRFRERERGKCFNVRHVCAATNIEKTQFALPANILHQTKTANECFFPVERDEFTLLVKWK